MEFYSQERGESIYFALFYFEQSKKKKSSRVEGDHGEEFIMADADIEGQGQIKNTWSISKMSTENCFGNMMVPVILCLQIFF